MSRALPAEARAADAELRAMQGANGRDGRSSHDAARTRSDAPARRVCPVCGNRVCSCLVDTLTGQMRMVGLPEARREYVFHPGRRFRFDLAYPDRLVAIECDGGTWTGGRHVTGAGFERDCEKTNLAANGGWRVYRFTAAMVRDGRAVATLEAALKGAG